MNEIIEQHKAKCETCQTGSNVNYIEYIAWKIRADGTKVGQYPWEMTKKEYDFYKVEMPRRLKALGSSMHYEFTKLEKPTFQHWLPVF